MSSQRRIGIRIDCDIYKSFVDSCALKGVNLTTEITDLMISFSKSSFVSDKEKIKQLKEIERQAFLKNIREENKKDLHALYWSKNWAKKLYDFANLSLILSEGNDCNIEKLIHILKDSDKEFNKLTSKQKRLLKRERIHLQEWKNKDYVFFKMKYIKNLPPQQKNTFLLENKN